jgi:hypothetical protein
MRNRVPDEATCAICGRHFDPSETRGWCPNPSCGEWQHPSFPIDEDASGDEKSGSGSDATGDTGGSSSSRPTKACPNCGNEVRADANFCKHCATQLTGSEEPQPEPETGEDDGISQCPDCGADLSGIPSDRLSTCPICMFDLTPVIDEDGSGGGGEEDADTGTASGTETDTESLTECPNCGEDLTPIPSEMRTVCPGCRVDLADAEAGTGPTPAGGASAPPSGSSGVAARGGRERSHDPAATPLDEMEEIATGYVQRLSEVGVTTIGDLVGAEPDTVSAKTGISARRIRGWIDDAPVDPEDVDTGSQPGGAEPTGPSSQEVDTGSQSGGTGPSEQPSEAVDFQTRIQESPDEFVLEVMGQEIEVTDGETVGREVRYAMVDAGAPEEEAVYVHRKHIRIEFDDEEFYLTRLGENSLTVNGSTVEKGNRVRIGDGDEIRFSDVVTATVSIR